MKKSKAALMVIAALIGSTVLAQYPSATSKPIKLDTRRKGFELVVCAYSFRKYTALEAIEKTKEAGGEGIEFFLWQKFSPELPDMKVDQNLPDKQINTLRAKLQAWGVRPLNAYFSSANLGKSEEDARKLFVFAQKVGITRLTGEPAPAKLDLIEKLVKEFNIQFCYHNHAKNPERPNYRNWDPAYLMELMQDRDPRMGVCVDTGHIYRSGMNPVDYLKAVEGRVLAVHLKDVVEKKLGSWDVVYGKGAGDIPAILSELKRQDFNGEVGVEFDHVTSEIEQDVKACLDFLRARR